ncbi:ATP-grasp domain-containing protein [Candidatus Palauibacter polyketidifaciens]|uniref:ATP-grasp domain-containing protein n=1 Tax=Candidatus Palauibacter polyketidifaciens TaxID=3056740 RepID=UPI00139C20B9|nr:ATP-grasp domain-containing protein [Candidatus Palauibacter polyketidifaciens]MDE2721643.1 ATP-grasp domain-containing protein [Candidatus Palauibacter polyketidifaciens]MYE34649.1 ATP-grasp domain-containing protein [Gemmatimonadales bacterium]
MPNVAFVAPFYLPTTLRFLEAAAGLAGVRLGVVTQEPLERTPASLRRSIAAHVRVEDALSAEGIHIGLRRLSAELGGIDRLLGALEELQVPLGELRDALGIPGMGAGAADNFRDKSRMKDVLRAHGLPCARHALVRDGDEATAFSDATGFPLIVKPPAGSGARGTFRVETAEQLRAAIAMSRPSAERPTLVEEFVVGEEHSFDAVSIGGRLVWHSINHYLPSPLEVLREPWIQWCVLLPRKVDSPRYAEIRRVAGPALDSLGMETGLSHMEWFRRPDGSVAISEVGARPPGAQFVTLISQAHDFDLYRAWAHLLVFDEFDPPPRPYAAGAAYLRGQGRGSVRRVAGIEEIAKDLGPLCVEWRLPRAGQAQSASYEGEGYIIVRHPRTEVVEEALGRIITRVRVELAT